MLRRLAALMLLLLLLPACAEDAAPLSLREADSLAEAEAFLLFPPEDGTAAVQPGFIRVIAQHSANDPAFRAAYWLGGEPGSELDLTCKANRYGAPYNFYASTMCTRAVYSMALSYLGVDATPGAMSAMTGRRDLNPPYNAVSKLVGVELVAPRAHIFNTMVDNYLADPSYSPVYVYLELPDGSNHAVLIIAKLPEKSRFVVLDPAGMWINGVQHRVYMMSFNKTREKVVNSTFASDFAGSRVLKTYQWRLVPPDSTPAP